MENYSFEEIKSSIIDLYEELLSKVSNDFDIELSKNEEDTLIIDFSFENCLAQLTVSKPSFAPYKNVSFEAMTFESEEAEETGYPELVYFLYDSDYILKEEIIEELNSAIKFCLDYLPNQLKRKFTKRKGQININDKKNYRVIHPDDLEISSINSLDGEFICTSTYAQYIIVENGSITIKILPSIFRTVQNKIILD